MDVHISTRYTFVHAQPKENALGGAGNACSRKTHSAPAPRGKTNLLMSKDLSDEAQNGRRSKEDMEEMIRMEVLGEAAEDAGSVATMDSEDRKDDFEECRRSLAEVSTCKK